MFRLISFLLIFFVFSQVQVNQLGQQSTRDPKGSPLLQYFFQTDKKDRGFEIFSKKFGFNLNEYGQLWVSASENIEKNVVLMRYPIQNQNVISIENIKKNYTVSGIDDLTLLCLFLYYEKFRCGNERSLYRAYMDDISIRHSQLKTPLYWNEKILNELQESSVMKRVLERKSQVKNMYESINSKILDVFPLNCKDKAWKDVLNFDQFKWIYSMVHFKRISREFKIFPFIDLFYFPEAPSVPNMSVELGINEKTLVSTFQPVKKGERLFFNEPARSQELLLNQGMCVMTNPTSYYQFDIEKYLKRYLYENRNHKIILKWLKKLKMDQISYTFLHSETNPYEIDPSLILYLRLVSVHAKDIKSVEKEIPRLTVKIAIHKRNEHLMLQKLRTLFEKLLKEYSTSFEQDEKLFKENMNVEMLNCAILIRMNEKKVLKNIIQKIKEVNLK